jgi:hypothetical protein
MAEFKFSCPQCGQHIQCDISYVGMQIDCPICQKPIAVPQPPRAAAAIPKSQIWRKVFVIAASVVVLAGLVIGGWYGYSKIRLYSERGRQTFNIDFGPGKDASKQVGSAVVGQDGDYWNGVAIGFNNDHTESDLKFANGQPSPIEVQLINLGGGWGNGGKMGVKAPMLDSFNYPANNRGGNSRVILSHVPPGTYSLYLYGHGVNPLYYGDYTVSVAGNSYGRKKTSTGSDAAENTSWVEGSQYVRFPAVKVAADENIKILIRPGGWINGISDAMICGLQLVLLK